MISILFSFFVFFVSCNNEEYFTEELLIDNEIIEEEEEEEEEVPEDSNEETPTSTEDVFLDEIVSSELKAFPTAEGAGGYASGGRGGKVLHVTTLEDGDFEGTFRWAVTRKYPRIVVFDVSGTIKTNDYIEIRHGNLTIAGQTAPKGGITIEGPRVGAYNTSNIIIRYIRFVNTNYFFDTSHSAFGGGGLHDVVMDHCSFRYTATSPAIGFQDNNNQDGGQGEISIQRNIIGDCYTGILVGAVAVDDSRVVLAGSNSVHKNLFVHVDHRFPNVSGNAQAEIVNNVVFNFRNRLCSFFNNSESNVIGNYYKAGPVSGASYGARHKIGDYLTSTRYLIPKLFVDNNKIIDKWNPLEPGEDNWERNVVVWNGDPADQSTYRAYSPFPNLGVPIETYQPDYAYDNILEDSGANASIDEKGVESKYLDIVDEQFVADVRENSCDGCYQPKPIEEPEWFRYRPKTDRSKMIYPELPTNTRGIDFDTDRDGMPDLWEIAMGLNPNEDDSFLDLDNDGYTNIEEFINLVDVQ
ncbi:hypothetical protein [Seonamhaeicola marinus]|uniref:Pectate lyase C n=1 Tax=Seonamhaeicola marinus TaxID=1912246 RepID=A0A5D0HLL3_9FLAO|nr:hypothetical protein [Seonamhaeicola marinus]TYA71870.1 hypothetical protein FUA24_20180 [Seonamhaeicola marinus]